MDGVGYTWDDGVRTYDYDYANRLVQRAAAARASGTFTTTYGHDGQWVRENICEPDERE